MFLGWGQNHAWLASQLLAFVQTGLLSTLIYLISFDTSRVRGSISLSEVILLVSITTRAPLFPYFISP